MNRTKVILLRSALFLQLATLLALTAAAISTTTKTASAAAAPPSIVKRGEAPDLTSLQWQDLDGQCGGLDG